VKVRITTLRISLSCLIYYSLFIAVSSVFAADEYSFDISAYEKNPFTFGGYGELRWEHFNYDSDTAIYQLNYFGLDQPEDNDRYTAGLQLEGRYSKNQFSAYVRLNPETYNDDLSNDSNLTTHEAFVSWQAKPGINLDAGKKLTKWGKGYAWNPVGFIERPKDPNDPDLAREGFTTIAADWIISLGGQIQTVTFTPVYLPVTEDMNGDFGPVDNNYAAKLYLLYRDTDIDVMFLSEGSRSARYGVDFSRNVSTNFEVHGEWAYITDVAHRILNDLNSLDVSSKDSQSWLLGLRYLTENDTTYIAEYYYNGAGYTEEQMRDFYRLIENVPNLPDTDLAIARARAIAQSGYIRQTNMRRYLYVRVMQKEPFDWLYWTPAVNVIVNIDDSSYNLAPEIVYTGVTNLELRFKINYLQGDDYSEFGEKQNDSKLELRMRYFF